MEMFGYEFKNEELLAEALTTPAYRMEVPNAKDNQRLEFLGDAVLGLLSAELLYNEYESEHEGSLTIRRTQMVSSKALCEAANRFGLATQLRRNRGAADLAKDSKTLADAIEAIIGAAYLDGGLEAARKIFTSLELTSKATAETWTGNPKGELQIIAQAMVPPRHPEYTLLKTEGKAHEPVFTVRVVVEGLGEAESSAGSLKKAESQAAAKILAQYLKVHPELEG